jgi:hypothetical protein
MQGRITKKKYLNDMRGRLKAEVKPYLTLTLRRNGKNRNSTGYWAMVRVLVPVIEAAGQVLYPGMKDGWHQGAKILEDLKVPYPIICWKLFRDSLIHSDEMMNVINDQKELYSGWSLAFGGGHEVANTTAIPHIDLKQLYDDFMEYLRQTAIDSKPKEYVILRAIRFSQKQFDSWPELEREYKDLFSEIERILKT